MLDMVKYRLRKRRVHRGAVLLDEHMPDWWKHINKGDLDIRTDSDCVMGQLSATPAVKNFCGNYGRDWQHTGRYMAHRSGIPFQKFRYMHRYGFGVRTKEENKDLNQLWLGEVFDRKMADPNLTPDRDYALTGR